MKKAWLIAGIVLLGVLSVVGGLAVYKGAGDPPAGAGGFEPTESVEIVTAREIEWQPKADLVGTVIAVRSVVVQNELAGVVTALGFESGAVVQEGQVLVEQDPSVENADLDAAGASVRVAEARIDQANARIRLAELELQRLASAAAGQAVAPVEVDRAEAELETARADRTQWLAEADQARARVAQVEARLAKLTIRAPFRARAGLRAVHEGQYLAEGADIVALQELTDSIFLDFAIPQEYAPRVTPGTAVMATGALLGPDPVRIEVVAVDATVNYDTRNLRVRAVVDNRSGTLVPGMFVQVRVPIDTPRRHVVVPGTAIRRAAYANSVFVIASDESAEGVRARQRFVKLGETVGEDAIVLEGLKPGEQIAAAGSFKLHDGIKVMVAPAAPPGGAGGPAGGTAHEDQKTGEEGPAAAGT